MFGSNYAWTNAPIRVHISDKCACYNIIHRHTDMLTYFHLGFTLRVISQLVTLQSAMGKAESVVASRDNKGQFTTSEMQSHEATLGQNLEALLSGVLPRKDPIVGEATQLLSTLSEMRMRIEVTPRHRVLSNIHRLLRV